MQVAIIGAGIGGLSTYLWLKELLPHQEDHDIMIYESQQSAKPRVTYDNPDFTPVAPDAEGSTLILDPSGLKVPQRLGDEVFHNVVGTGAPISSHWYRSSRGFSLTNIPAGELEPERMTCVAISRQGLWNCLRRRIPDYAIQIAQVSEVVAGGSGKIIRFNDGTYSVTADVVIGADGVNSVVRKAVLGEQKYRELAPVYAGMVSVGGFMASYHLPEDKKQKGAITRVMGRRGYFDYGSITSPLSEPSRHLPIRALPTGEQAWWDSVYMIAECPDKRTLNKDDIRKQLKERHGNWKDPTTRYCIEQGEIEGVYCIFSMPMLPLWDNDNVILIGDAAHTLLPSSGHGACQALEDAEALARLTSHFLHKVYGSISDDSDFQIDEGQAIAVAAKKFHKMRAPRIQQAMKNSTLAQNKKQGIFSEWMMYGLMRACGNKPSVTSADNSGILGKLYARFVSTRNPIPELVRYDLLAEVQKMINEGGFVDACGGWKCD